MLADRLTVHPDRRALIHRAEEQEDLAPAERLRHLEAHAAEREAVEVLPVRLTPRGPHRLLLPRAIHAHIGPVRRGEPRVEPAPLAANLLRVPAQLPVHGELADDLPALKLLGRPDLPVALLEPREEDQVGDVRVFEALAELIEPRHRADLLRDAIRP